MWVLVGCVCVCVRALACVFAGRPRCAPRCCVMLLGAPRARNAERKTHTHHHRPLYHHHHHTPTTQGPGTDQAVVAQIRDAVKAGDELTVRLLNYRRDGSPFWNMFTLAPMRDADGTIRFFVGVQVDVTAPDETPADAPCTLTTREGGIQPSAAFTPAW